VVREKGGFAIYEEPMLQIDLASITDVRKNNHIYDFNDGNHVYKFNESKSTLLKRFDTRLCVERLSIDILESPFSILESLLGINSEFQPSPLVALEEGTIESENSLLGISKTIYLPLYGRGERVYDKSGLNQWNAGGRDRNIDEVYIPVPMEIHSQHPDFFPPNGGSFELKFGRNRKSMASLCQAGFKALMTNPNKDLGKWLLRDMLDIPEGELATKEMLDQIGIDSVRIDKMVDGTFEISLSKTGSYAEFMESSVT